MDPYLETSTWMNFHSQMCVEIARQLGPKVRPRYLARVNERTYTEIGVAPEEKPERPRLPDVAIVRASDSPHGDAAVATVPAIAPVRMATAMPERLRHFVIEIRDVKGRRLVTSIELLSPTNKRGRGRREYLDKRLKLMRNDVNLVEIDLLHGGERLPMRKPLPPAAYYVYVGRSEDRPMTDVYPIAINHPLPPIPIPLLPDDPDVTLDLQQALSTVYDLSDYDRELDYTKPPEVRLPPDEAAWVHDRLGAAGLRY
jgi:hypothetical protein